MIQYEGIIQHFVPFVKRQVAESFATKSHAPTAKKTHTDRQQYNRYVCIYKRQVSSFAERTVNKSLTNRTQSAANNAQPFVLCQFTRTAIRAMLRTAKIPRYAIAPI